jgi:hypothetical protein
VCFRPSLARRSVPWWGAFARTSLQTGGDTLLPRMSDAMLCFILRKRASDAPCHLFFHQPSKQKFPRKTSRRYATDPAVFDKAAPQATSAAPVAGKEATPIIYSSNPKAAAPTAPDDAAASNSKPTTAASKDKPGKLRKRMSLSAKTKLKLSAKMKLSATPGDTPGTGGTFCLVAYRGCPTCSERLGDNLKVGFGL